MGRNVSKDVIHLSSNNLATKIEADRYGHSINNYLRFFLGHKFKIFFVFIAAFVVSFILFQNKNYKAQIGFIVNSQNDLKSNLLEGALGDFKLPSSSFNNFSERLYRFSKSQSFYRELAQEIINSNEFDMIERNAIKNHQGSFSYWVKKEVYSNKDKINVVSKFLQRMISIRLQDDSELLFSINSKDKKQTLLVQKLVKEKSMNLLLENPQKEASTAFQIIQSKFLNNSDKLQEIASKKIDLQKEYDTPFFEDYAAKYSQFKVNIERDIEKHRANRDIYRVRLIEYQQKFAYNPLDYSAKEVVNETSKLLEQEIIKLKSLQNAIKEINRKQKNIPELISKTRALIRDEKLLEKELFALTTQKTMAELALKKISESIKPLSIDESIETIGKGLIVFKATLLSLTMVFLFSVLVYYKQSFFPVLFSVDEVERTRIPYVGPFNNTKEDRSNNEYTVKNNFPIAALVEQEYLDKKISSFTSVSPLKKQWLFYLHTVQETLEQGSTVYSLSFNLKNSQKKELDKLKDNYPKSFSYNNIIVNFSKGVVLNSEKIKETIFSKSSDSVLINAMSIADFTNKAIVAGLSHHNYEVISLFETKLSYINKFTKFYNITSSRMNQKHSFIILNSRSEMSNVINNLKKTDNKDMSRAV